MESNQAITQRAKTFSDIIGQPQVTTYLKNKAKQRNWPTAILLSGPTGSGKTTAAYLIAMAINCEKPLPDGNPCLTCPSCRSILDVTFTRDTRRLKCDSSGGKEDVQEFLIKSDSKPLYDRKKIYIIEEADQLSSAAKNSLHTILENPRDHLHFIFLSMIPNGIPRSIKNRCTPLIFNPLKIADLMMIMKVILERNNLWDDPELPKEFKLDGLKLISSCAMGSARDAIQNLEKCVASKYYTVKDIKDNIEKANIEAQIEAILMNLIDGKKEEVYATISSEGFDIMELLKTGYYRIARALIFRATGTSDYESYEGFYKHLTESSNFMALASFFKNLSERAVNYIRLGDFVMLLEQYFTSWKLPERKVR